MPIGIGRFCLPKGKIVAHITFTNGAVKWAIIEKDHAVLLS